MPRPATLTPELLNTFVTLVRLGGDAGAAKAKLGIEQPSMSKRLRYFQYPGPLIRKPWLDRFCIVVSAIPIALLTNIIRITATGIMYQTNREFAHRFFHDLAGWFMMPSCLAFLGAELWIMNRLIIEARPARPSLGLK